MKKYILILLFVLILFQVNAQQSTTGQYPNKNIKKGITNNFSKTQVIINNIPTYIWHRGCGPTALGMLIGYYDMLGYTDLISGDASTQTVEVNNAIATQEHYDDYSLPIDYYPDLYDDKSTLGGAHTSNCIADFMETSWSSKNNRYGWSYSNKIDNAFNSYINMQNSDYETFTQYEYFGSYSWDYYKFEIDNNRPVILLVDTDGNGNTDHFVTGIGYDEENLRYAIYDTWDSEIHWFDWRGLADGNDWGIYGFNILRITSPLSTNLISKNKIKTFPVPTKDILNIKINSLACF